MVPTAPELNRIRVGQRQQFGHDRGGGEVVVCLDADGDAEPASQRNARFEDPGRVPQLPPAGLRVRAVGGQRTAEHADQRGLPVTGQLEEAAQVGTWISTGQPDGAADRDDRQPGGRHGPLDPSASGDGHARVDELAVDEPQFDAGVAPAATE
jgi:hypothetical protein